VVETTEGTTRRSREIPERENACGNTLRERMESVRNYWGSEWALSRHPIVMKPAELGGVTRR